MMKFELLFNHIITLNNIKKKALKYYICFKESQLFSLSEHKLRDLLQYDSY